MLFVTLLVESDPPPIVINVYNVYEKMLQCAQVHYITNEV